MIQRTKYKGKYEFVIDGFSYGFASPTANFTPWNNDEQFMSVYSHAKKNTLVDIYRCFELWQLADKAYELDNNASMLEVGVWRGGTAAVIAQRLKDRGAKLPFYIADTFTGVAKASDNDPFYTGNEHADTSQKIVEELLNNKIGYKNVQILKGIFPEDSQHLVPATDKFSLCHIDVDVHDSARDIVDWIWDKLIVGGIIVFDDYGFHTCSGIARYVEAQRHKTDRVVIHNLNGHAVIIKIK